MITGFATLQREAATVQRLIHAYRQADASHRLAPKTAVEMAVDLGLSLDEWQARSLATDARNVILLASRQAGKSTVAGVAAIHQAVYNPGSLTLIVSPSERQSKRLLRLVRNHYERVRTIASAVAGGTLSLELSNGSEIHALPGSEATIRGFSSVDLIVLDESARVEDDLFYAVRPMLAVSNGRLLALSTPFGKRGWFFDEWTNGEGWHRELVPATKCPRISAEFLERERRSLPPIWFRQEYLCEFTEAINQIFDFDMIQAALTDEIAPLFALEDSWNARSNHAPLF